MSAPIFISFASKDLSVAQTVCEALENRGFHCWISSRDIGPGENFQVAIVRAIRLAKAMILIFSGHSNISEEVKKELVLAGQNRLVVIPLRVEDVAPDEAFAYEFATRQWIDAFHDWEHAIQRVVEQLRLVDDLGEAPAQSEGAQNAGRRRSPLPAETGRTRAGAEAATAAAAKRPRGWRWVALPALSVAAAAAAGLYVWSVPFGSSPAVQTPKIADAQPAAGTAASTAASRAPTAPATPAPPAPSVALATPPALHAPLAPAAAPAPPPEAAPAPPAEAPVTAVSLDPHITDIGIGARQAPPGSELLGRWHGFSTCAQGDIGIELALKEVRPDGAVHGSLRFFNLPGHSNTAEGEYTLQGRYYQNDRTLYLQPGNWVKQPPGYSMANFSFAFAPGGQSLNGRVTNISCSTISVTKETGAPSGAAAPGSAG